jgi:hypothetical protein
VYVSDSVCVGLRRGGSFWLGMCVGVRVRKRKLALQMARVISDEGGRIKAWVVSDDSLRCVNGINMVACLNSVRLGRAVGGKRVNIGHDIG